MTGAGPGFFQRTGPCRARCAHQRLFFYPGSSIGNFTPDPRRATSCGACAPVRRDGALLIGIDLVKDSAVLDAAYDDALGVTAAFNLNLLRHVNRWPAPISICASGATAAFSTPRKPHRNAPGSARRPT
jgi:uncharacterized SAM-dependent methyltransferase